jgi:hypothetical protein
MLAKPAVGLARALLLELDSLVQSHSIISQLWDPSNFFSGPEFPSVLDQRCIKYPFI